MRREWSVEPFELAKRRQSEVSPERVILGGALRNRWFSVATGHRAQHRTAHHRRRFSMIEDIEGRWKVRHRYDAEQVDPIL